MHKSNACLLVMMTPCSQTRFYQVKTGHSGGWRLRAGRRFHGWLSPETHRNSLIPHGGFFGRRLQCTTGLPACRRLMCAAPGRRIKFPRSMNDDVPVGAGALRKLIALVDSARWFSPLPPAPRAVRYRLPVPLIDRNRNAQNRTLDERTPRFPPPLRASALNSRHPLFSVSSLYERRRPSRRGCSPETPCNSLILRDGFSCGDCNVRQASRPVGG